MELIGDAIRVWIIMLDPRLFAVFLTAAFLLAITPGPGIFYVLTRTLTGGTQEGVLSSLGTFLGGLIHVIAAALGFSAILSTSATAFLIVKYVGAVYLIWIGIKMIRTRDREPGKRSSSGNSTRAIHQGVLTELLNPKTALFFLSFLPQFVSPEKGNVVFQFLVLGIDLGRLKHRRRSCGCDVGGSVGALASNEHSVSQKSTRCLRSRYDRAWYFRGLKRPKIGVRA